MQSDARFPRGFSASRMLYVDALVVRQFGSKFPQAQSQATKFYAV
jgi:hypothetical protein